MIWLTLGLMAALVFISRYTFLEPKLPLALNKNIKHFLSYAAPAVLTAIIAPIIFVHEHTLQFSIDNSYLIGAIIAVFIAGFTKNTLLTVLVSMLIFFFIL